MYLTLYIHMYMTLHIHMYMTLHIHMHMTLQIHYRSSLLTATLTLSQSRIFPTVDIACMFVCVLCVCRTKPQTIKAEHTLTFFFNYIFFINFLCCFLLYPKQMLAFFFIILYYDYDYYIPFPPVSDADARAPPPLCTAPALSCVGFR